MAFEEEIKKLLKDYSKEVVLEVPPDPKLGDFAFPCFSLAKSMKKSPVEIAKEIASKIKASGNIEKIVATGPYINFFLKKGNLAEETLKNIFREKDDYGKGRATNKKVVIEYPGPNTNKPLHLGHVRNMVLGYSFSRVLEFNGKKVITVNINNDRGIHICKSMLAYKKWGKNDSPEKSKLKPDFFVGKYYVMFAKKVKENPELEKEAQDMLKKWEEGDKETIELWKKMNRWAFDGFKETYKTFDIKFEKEYYESETYEKGKDIVVDGLKKGIFEKDEKGNIVADLEKEGFGKKVLLRADGTTVYVTQDLYLAKAKYDDFRYDKSIYVVATEQNYHFNVLFSLLKKLKFPFADKCEHFAYGMVNLTTGKMKSREGTVVDADTLVNDMVKLAKEETKKRHKKLSGKELSKRAEQIGMSAIRFYLLKYDAVKDILFDPKESISFEGETGPYVQYVHARCSSVMKKAKKEATDKVKFDLLKEEDEKNLIILLNKFPDAVKDAANYKPHLIARYLIELCQLFNTFYHNCLVIQKDKELEKARLLLVDCVKTVVKNGLYLLGIEAPEEM
ncbi:arginine--tRNA ligase [Candidatus Woesearchaeota archaeon]|nr:arginine--tRNA ligase [Candidatus Woesearchaeota archaeon]